VEGAAEGHVGKLALGDGQVDATLVSERELAVLELRRLRKERRAPTATTDS
jgi:hypothetical protein